MNNFLILLKNSLHQLVKNREKNKSIIISVDSRGKVCFRPKGQETRQQLYVDDIHQNEKLWKSFDSFDQAYMLLIRANQKRQ